MFQSRTADALHNGVEIEGEKWTYVNEIFVMNQNLSVPCYED